MLIDLDPPHGITGFPLGMPTEELKEAAARLGRLTVHDEGSTSRFRQMKVGAFHAQFEIIFHCADGKTLSAPEIWIPRPGSEEITVTFRGIDVFRTPALELLDRIREMGHDVLEADGDYPLVPRLTLGFTRTAGHDVPMADDDKPLYMQAVLVGPADYYDEFLAEYSL